jgi:hypothetical protein
MAAKAWSGLAVTRIDRKRLRGIDYVGDNMTLAPKLAKSGKFQIIDLDAYGNPWPLMQHICASLPSGRYGFAITCGIQRSLITHNKWALKLLGIPQIAHVNLLPFYEDIVTAAVMACGIDVDSVFFADPKKVGLTVRYWGVTGVKKTPGCDMHAAPGPANQVE